MHDVMLLCFCGLHSGRSGERRSDGGAVPSVKPASRPADRVRRDRYSPPPPGHHMSASAGQAEWKPPPTGDRSRSGHHDAKGKGSWWHRVLLCHRW